MFEDDIALIGHEILSRDVFGYSGFMTLRAKVCYDNIIVAPE